MSEDDETRTSAAYTLVNQDLPEYDEEVTHYPALANEPIYVVLNTITTDEANAIKPALSKAFLVVTGIEQAMADPEKAAALGEGSGFDLSTLPEGTDVFAMLSALPQAMRTAILTQVDVRFDAMGESMIEQAAIGAVKTEYAALGLDTSSLQNNYIIQAGLIMLGIALISGASTVAVGFLGESGIGYGVKPAARCVPESRKFFQTANLTVFGVVAHHALDQRCDAGLQTLIVMLIRMMIYAPILAVGGIIKAISTDASMWWTIAPAVTALISFIVAIFSLSLPKFKIIQKLVDRMNLVTRENCRA